MTKLHKEITRLWLRHILAVLSFVVSFLVFGFGWKFGLFKEEYKNMEMYRDDIFIPFAFGSMFVQAIFWTYVTYKFLNKEKFFALAGRIFILSAPLGISYGVFMVGAKHIMTSVSTFALFETPFLIITHLVISILMSACYTLKK